MAASTAGAVGPTASSAGSGEVHVVSALSSISRSAETVRTSLGQLDLVTTPSDEVVARLQASAAQMAALLRETHSTNLRYQAVRPVAVPEIAQHVPDFLATRKAAATAEADAAAERIGAAATIPTADYNTAIDALIRQYDGLARIAVAEFRASSAAAMLEVTRP